ncbi:MAG: MFS transporter [Tenuifilaceae bacterium]
MKKFLTRTIVMLSLVSLFTDIASEMLYPIMPVFLKSIGFSVLLIGILEGLAEATAGISKGYFGHLSDRLGTRVPFIRWGYTLSAISKPLMAVFTWPIWIFGARTLDRLGKGIRTSARDALLSDESTRETKGKVFGFHRGMDTLGAAIGPIAALIYLHFYPQNYSTLFLIAFAPGLVAVSLTLLLKDKKKPETSNQQVNPVQGKGFFSFVKYWGHSPKAFRYLVVGLLFFTLFNSSDAFLLLMVKEKGFSDANMISLYIFYNLLYALLAYPMGWLADKFGMKRIMIFGISVFGLVYLLFGFADKLHMFLLLFGLYAFYAAATEGVSKAWITNIVPGESTATAIGFYTGFQSVATLLASSMAGLIWTKFGASTVFVISGLAAFITAIYLMLATRMNKLA